MDNFARNTPYMLLRKIAAFVSLLTCVSACAFAGTIKGTVTDDKTHEPLTGATVTLADTKYTTVTGLDGSYIFKNIPAGEYKVVASFVGYKKDDEKVQVTATSISVADIDMNDAKEENNVVVKGGKQSTDKLVRKLEQNSDMVLNILSARAIQLSPDVTVANSLQRISGITIERSSSGEGRYAIIRGMDQRYNNTLVNGIKIPSPDDKYRYVPMDIFPSELLERLEVIKSLTPDMEGDAIGGTMNLVMKSAPDKMLFNINVSGGYSTLFSDRPFATFDHSAINKKSPGEANGTSYTATAADFPKANLDFQPKNNPINTTLGASFGNRFFNKKLGLVLSASFQDIYRGSNSDFFAPNSQPQENNKPQFNDILLRQYSTRNKRIGVHNKLDYIINPRNKISLYNLYLHMDEYQSRSTIDSSLSVQRTGPGNGNVALQYRSRWQVQSIYNSTLQGEHTLASLLKFNWSAVYSKAKNNLPDWAEFETVHEVKTDAAGKVTETPNNLGGMSRRWLHNSDEDLAGYANFIYNPTIAKLKVQLSAGGLYRHKSRDNYYNSYDLLPLTNNSVPQPFTNIYNAQFTFRTADAGKSSEANGNTYTSTEDIAAGYIQAKLMATDKLQVLGGVRIENTRQEYKSQLPVSLDSKNGTITYTDVLPSIHFKYELSSKQNLRLSYFKSISRPGFYEITPYEIASEYFNEVGNPYLKHTQADNFDLRYEFFPKGADQLLAGVFYKNINNPIEYSIITVNNGKKTILQPNNFGNAKNYGFEMVFTKYFGKIGIATNYTYTKSSITTTKSLYVRNAVGQLALQTPAPSQTRPLQGQADHIGNMSLLFKDGKIGLDAQLSFVYTGKRISQVSPFYELDYWQRAYTQLDFSLEQRITKHFSFYAKVNNMTNTPRKVDILKPNAFLNGTDALPQQEDSDRILVQKDIYKLSFLTGFRYKF